MSVSGQVSIVSGVGTSLVFTVTGTSTLGYATDFQNAIVAAQTAGSLNIVDLTSTPAPSSAPDSSTNLYEIQSTGSVTIPAGGGYAFDTVSGATSITGSGDGDTVLVAAVNPEATYFDVGGNNTITFVSGNNHYVGDTASGATGVDTVVAGTGFDTIDTGVGSTIVDSGTGDAVITLNDTVTPGTGLANDYVYLDDGHAIVNMDGVSDVVVATHAGQTINGGMSADAQNLVVLTGNSGATVVNAGAGFTAVYDLTDGNTVIGGSGQLYFVSGADLTTTITGGSGSVIAYGAHGDNLSLIVTGPAAPSAFVAGGGNETLSGAGSTTTVEFYGDNSANPGETAGVKEVMIGGVGNDSFVTGAGAETLTGGGGSNNFYISETQDGVGASIVITDFGANDTLGFAGFSQSDIQTALDGATTGQDGLTITLSDHTTVTFNGITNVSQLNNGHTS